MNGGGGVDVMCCRLPWRVSDAPCLRLTSHCASWCPSESGQPICGNGLVEQGEQCDCGYSDQCKDECCFDANQAEDRKCKLRPGKQCRYRGALSALGGLLVPPGG